MDYLSIDVSIDHTEDGYFVRVANAPTGEAVAKFQSPFTPAEQDMLHRLIATGEARQSTGEESDVTLQQWGTRLFQALFPGPLQSILQSNYHLAYQARAKLRIRLQINHAPRLAMLPWEYLFDPVRNEFMVLSSQSILVRYTNLMHQIVPFKAESPLRMLVVISSPGGYPPFDRERAWFTILDTLDYLALENKLVIERLTKPTLLDLQRRLRQKECHILHFIGHGNTDELTGEAALIFEDEMGRGRRVNGEHLGSLLRDHFPLRLITLTAGDVVRTATANPYLKIAANLIQRGLPAVMATHSSLTLGATATFVHKFYTGVANFVPVDIAMSEARWALSEDQQASAWGLPALFIRTPEGQLFTSIQPDWQKLDQEKENVSRRRRFWPAFVKR